MNGTQDTRNPQQIIEQNLRERMASLEATNNFHRETLNDISSSLKEVVKTQHVLANQRDEILKLVRVVAEIQQEMVSYKQDTFEMKYKVKTTLAKVEDMTKRYESMVDKVNTNANFVKNASKVISAIIVPMILAIIMQYLKGG